MFQIINFINFFFIILRFDKNNQKINIFENLEF